MYLYQSLELCRRCVCASFFKGLDGFIYLLNGLFPAFDIQIIKVSNMIPRVNSLLCVFYRV